jgi:hypothetical protein
MGVGERKKHGPATTGGTVDNARTMADAKSKT